MTCMYLTARGHCGKPATCSDGAIWWLCEQHGRELRLVRDEPKEQSA